MALSLAQILPNSSNGLGGTGFLFGAGTSVEAGYPMMADLTRKVVGALSSSEREAMDEVLTANSISFNSADSTPNIEAIADLVIAHSINSGHVRFLHLEERLRVIVTETILAVAAPNLDHHIRFLSLLKQRAYGQAACIYIFTTNYDVLFELAGSHAGVGVETGFIGSIERYFDQQRFTTACGSLQSQSRFAEHPVLTVRLIKLHGSISWLARNGTVFERHPASIGPADQRVMILPRRRKVMDALQPPHDSLFTVISRVLGADCKYIVSCGFSFGDDHINQNLLLPAVTSGKIRLFALCAEETVGMASMKSASAFSAGFNLSGISAGFTHDTGTDCWKFSKFVNLFE